MAEEFAKTTFDFVVVGGGPGGLAVAARLSENPQHTVAVLEAGLAIQDDPLIDVPRYMGRALANPQYDWAFKTVPQEHGAGRVIAAPRGKILGGSTALNFMAWDRPSKAEYDAWPSLLEGNASWDWDGIAPYLKKSENHASPSVAPDPLPSFSKDDGNLLKSEVALNEVVGSDGPVKTSYNNVYTDAIPPFVNAWNEIGQKTNTNAYAGDTCGVFNVIRSVDAETGKRTTAASAYYYPNASRKNLTVLTGAHATRVVLGRDSADKLTASGVAFVHEGKEFVVNASKEVILAAGSVQTPQLLELSGIGQAELLKNLDISCLVDLPGVGENLADHVFVPVQFTAVPGIRTFDEFRNVPEFLTEQEEVYKSTKKGWLSAIDSAAVFTPLGQLTDPANFASFIGKVESLIADPALSPLTRAQYVIYLDWLKKSEVSDIETILFSRGVVNPQPGKSYFCVLAGIQHPFSRGSIHIASKDPLAPPTIDPKYLSNPLDVELLTTGYRTIEKLAQTEALKAVVEAQSVPPVALKEDAHVAGFIQQAFSSGSHLMGTAAMARQELGGVVGGDLVVHGTSNLRIADSSIIPVPVATHLQATVYAIGEKAADLIKKRWA